jgi:DNA-binding transcriptional LysR family regulator
MDRLQAMKTFVHVAEAEGFAEAARRLRISPSTASRAVSALEEELGVTLLSRTTRVVRLTERGALYLDHCRRILEDMVAADREVRGESAEPRGRLAVTAPVCFGRLAVLPLVQRLVSAHPELSVRLTLLDRVVDLIQEGMDVGVRIGALADSGLLATRVGETRRVVVAAPGYVERHGAPTTPADLKAHRIIVFESIEATREWRFDAASPAVRIDGTLSVNNVDAAVAAAEAGVGLTRVLCYQVKDALAAGRLQLLLEDVAPPPVPVSLLRPAHRGESPNVAAFMRAAKAHFREHPVGIGPPGDTVVP